jgi:hypothetical protein
MLLEMKLDNPYAITQQVSQNNLVTTAEGNQRLGIILSPDLTLQKMYNLCKEQNPETNVSKHLYDDTFRSDFNLTFGVQCSDTFKYSMNFLLNSLQQMLKKSTRRFSYGVIFIMQKVILPAGN